MICFFCSVRKAPKLADTKYKVHSLLLLSDAVTVACRDRTRLALSLFQFNLYQMPGPSNSNVKRKRKSRGKDNKQNQNILLVSAQPQLSQESTAQEPPTDHKSILPSLPPPPCLRTPSPLPYQLQNSKERLFSLDDHVPGTVEEVMLKQPFIYDPGNGPRVRIAKEFISSFFAQPPAYDVGSMLFFVVV